MEHVNNLLVSLSTELSHHFQHIVTIETKDQHRHYQGTETSTLSEKHADALHMIIRSISAENLGSEYQQS